MRNGTYALLIDGGTVEIRPARPGDFDAVRDMHAALSPKNAYLRFFNLSPLNAEREARRVCREPGPDHAALLAWLGGELAGVASYEVTGKPDVAEIALAVPDHLHGRGIATLLLEHLVSVARRRKLRAFTAVTLAENAAMLARVHQRRPAGAARACRRRGRADLPAARRRGRPQARRLPGLGRGAGKPARTWPACATCCGRTRSRSSA